MLRRWIVCAALAAMLNASGAIVAGDYIGKKIESFSLSNAYGKSVALSEFEDKKIVVVAFLGVECPLAKLYGRRLRDMQNQLADQGVQFIGINSNKQDSLTELLAYQNRYEIPFPMLKDVGNRVADAFNAKRTPEAFVLDSERVVRYHGRIDDQYGVGYSREHAEKSELLMAVERLLEGKDVEVAETDVVGCHIGRIKHVDAVGDITYTRHIAPILNSRCVSCHREGEIAPFTLTRYDDLLGWEETILEVLDENRMPPWSANPTHGKFSNDPRLSDDEKALITTWVENGMPEGDPADLPDPPSFTPGWQIGTPDQIIKMNDKPFQVPAEGIVDYQRFVVDPGWDEDKYIVEAEARPQNRAVVHHILAYIIPPGERRIDLKKVLVGYAPGGLPVRLEDGVALKIPARSKLLFEMHYTPNGETQSDLSYVGVRFTDQSKVKKLIQGRIAANHKFQIPPRDPHFPVLAQYKAKQDERLLSMTPHMHLRGKAFRYEAHYPDGETEILLDVPAYDFNWQLKYVLEEPKLLRRGTVIKCTAWYDNSEQNLSNPNPERTVGWGDQSRDEMMIGFMDTVPVKGTL